MLAYAPRALLQIFITNTFNHRFAGVVFCVALLSKA
jgi:hypothetical protein